jgi:hypothetical protein
MRGPTDRIGKAIRLVNLDEDLLCVLGRVLQSGRLFLPGAEISHVFGHYVGVTKRDRLSID